MKFPFRRLTPCLLVVLFATGCGKSTTQSSQNTPPVVGLNVNNVAPEIEGSDADATPFKLSDYRGKVVMLDFWGNW